MKNPLKKTRPELDLSNATELLAAGAAAGMAVASFAGKKGNIGGIIGAGFTLLLGGIIVAMEDEGSNKYYVDK
ncbi:hypothetical protein HNQ02_000651 [Flavobacterium sp. 7E]|uniref:hypothetical protein n=1 Tax=Flavobacterium sp. 7E TaxID=2735898 RepID=UPI0015703CFA|nr:hypothetical protein [Flavobacterium sp. 7E]NRS87744.1 hypothetical protein [Flavobacterium sp. 7E]